jgi:hypothetical protein
VPNFGSAVQFNRIPGLQFVAEKSATPPSNPVSGQLWTDTSVSPNKVRWYDGTKWVAADYTSLADGYITNAHVAGDAAIALSKLAVDPLARANHTGTQPANTISDFDTQVRTNRLDQLANPNTALDVNGQRINNVATPTLASDAANKAYVDNSRAGISVKDPVRVALTSNVNLDSPGASPDGVNLSNGDRFLAAGQSVGTQNGLYVYNGASTPATRAPDADTAGEVFDGSMVAVAEGSHAGYQFIQTDTASGAPGSWTQTWIVFITGGQTYLPGNGLAISGTTFSLDGPVSVANGGTGASTALGARTNLGALTRFTASNTAWTAGVTYTIEHGLNTQDVGAFFKTVADYANIDFDWYAPTVNTVSVKPDLSYAAGTIKIAVFG